MKQIFPGVFKMQGNVATRNAVPGKSIYGEKRVKVDGVEYRVWDPRKSKPAAAILKGLENFPIRPGISILYLGIADGTTASHFSDIVGDKGMIFGIDIASKPFEKLLALCEDRKNIIPILADANKPDDYKGYVEKKVDVVYQDLAQKNQAEILIKNVKRYLKKNGFIVFMIKARSINVTAKPSKIFKSEIEKLKKEGLEVVEVKRLSPYELDHAVVVGKLTRAT